MKTLIEPADLSFFASVGGSGSLSAAARELGVTTAAVSKHLSQMEQRIGTLLLHRTSRRMSLTPEGELYLDHARKILGQIGELEHQLGMAMATPTGLVRVNATLGFGRTHIAPLISRFTAKHPSVEVQLQLSVNPPPVTEDAFDACIRFGEPPDARVIAAKLASNRRMLCASPVYLKKHGLPKTPADLMNHNCIGIRQGSEAYGAVASAHDQAERPGTGHQDPWQSVDQRRRDRGQVGTRRTRHPDACRVGHSTLPAQRPAGAGAAAIRDAQCRYLRGLSGAP